MHISLSIQWHLNLPGPRPIDPHLLRLLHAVQRDGSLASAALSSGLSYRYAWGLLRKWQGIFGRELVIMQRGRGRGASLTEFGDRLVRADLELGQLTAPALDVATAGVNRSLSEFMQPSDHGFVRIYASHGLAIHQLYELLQQDRRFRIDFQTRGSLDSLQALHAGQCQLAGFHLPLQKIDQKLAPRYEQWLAPGRHRLMLVEIREQGILVRAGNPKNIRTLKDLTKRSVRYINRQRNSGTRTIFDELLRLEGIDSGRINGYANEEFTHSAVAALIAGGAADAGFGIKAATDGFPLDFISYLHEAYVIAGGRHTDHDLFEQIESLLQSARFRRKMNRLPGVDTSRSGEKFTFRHLLEIHQIR